MLQVSGTGTGADITQQPTATATSQQWQVTDHGGGTISLTNRASGLAMDVWSAATTDGARISQWNLHRQRQPALRTPARLNPHIGGHHAQ